MKPKKIDKRMLGHGLFKYQTVFLKREIENFIGIRIWCWEQWGPSSELDFYYLLENKPPWSWVSDNHGRYRILLQSDKECSWYILNWLNK
jgi:hypothetical protein